MEDPNSSRCSLLIFLIVSGILTFVNGIEFYNFINQWNGGIIMLSPLFEQCIRFELIIKTVFSFFSLFASLSAFFVTILLMINTNLFLEKLSPTVLTCNYFIFGPVLLVFSTMGLINIENIIYSCDKNNLDYNNKIFSLSNFIAVIFCFIISLVLTIMIEFFNSVTIFIDSILRKSTGNKLLGDVFWFYISKYHHRTLRSFTGNNSETQRNNPNTNTNNLLTSNTNSNLNLNRQIENHMTEETSRNPNNNQLNLNHEDNTYFSRHNQNLNNENTILHIRDELEGGSSNMRIEIPHKDKPRNISDYSNFEREFDCDSFAVTSDQINCQIIETNKKYEREESKIID